MSRPLRVEYSGAIYHVMSRGNRRERIFGGQADYQLMLKTLGEACQKTGWQVHAFCLMRNHFHLVIETPAPNLVAGMKWLLGVYTKRFNIRHKTCGHLFAGRYKALPVDGSGNGYLRVVGDYVHLNPARAKLVAADAPLESYPWSSYCQYIGEPGRRAAWLRVDRLLGEAGIPRDSAAGRREFARRMESRRKEESGADYEEARNGWCLGDDDFRAELLAAAKPKPGQPHFGSQQSETALQSAEEIAREELGKHGWTEADLENHRKGDAVKVAIALRLRRDTTLTFAQIARRLRMGSPSHAANLVYQSQNTKKSAP